MRRPLLLTLCLLVGGSGLSQAPLPAPVAGPASLADRLQQADFESSLEDLRLRPWHLLLSFQLFDVKGAPSEQGQIEEVWLSPELYQISFTSPSYTSTTIRNSDGFYRTKGTPPPPELLDTLRRQVVHPMPAPLEITNSIPELKKLKLGNVPLDCIMLDHPIKNFTDAPLGLFPTFCMDSGKSTVRMSLAYASTVLVRNKIGLFQGRNVSVNPVVMIDDVQAASAHVDSLATVNLSTLTADPTTMEKRLGNPMTVAAATVAGTVLSQQQPIYPDVAKHQHITGTVVLHAIIGTDGRVHTLVPVSTPDSSLAVSAISAVSRWRYKPYSVNGEPVEVDTTITVNYEINW